MTVYIKFQQSNYSHLWVTALECKPPSHSSLLQQGICTNWAHTTHPDEQTNTRTQHDIEQVVVSQSLSGGNRVGIATFDIVQNSFSYRNLWYVLINGKRHKHLIWRRRWRRRLEEGKKTAAKTQSKPETKWSSHARRIISERERGRERKTNISIISSKINYCNHINSRGYREREREDQQTEVKMINDHQNWTFENFLLIFIVYTGRGRWEREREKAPGMGYTFHWLIKMLIWRRLIRVRLLEVATCLPEGSVYSQGCTAIIIWYFKTNDGRSQVLCY